MTKMLIVQCVNPDGATEVVSFNPEKVAKAVLSVNPGESRAFLLVYDEMAGEDVDEVYPDLRDTNTACSVAELIGAYDQSADKSQNAAKIRTLVDKLVKEAKGDE